MLAVNSYISFFMLLIRRNYDRVFMQYTQIMLFLSGIANYIVDK